MTRFLGTKTVGIALVISSLLVLLPSCEKKGGAEKAGEKIDNVVENIGENIDKAIDEAKD